MYMFDSFVRYFRENNSVQRAGQAQHYILLQIGKTNDFCYFEIWEFGIFWHFEYFIVDEMTTPTVKVASIYALSKHCRIWLWIFFCVCVIRLFVCSCEIVKLALSLARETYERQLTTYFSAGHSSNYPKYQQNDALSFVGNFSIFHHTCCDFLRARSFFRFIEAGLCMLQNSTLLNKGLW